MQQLLVKYGVGVALVTAIIITGVIGLNHQPKSDTAAPGTRTSVSPQATPSAATQLHYQGEDGKTALELLKAKDPSAVTKGEGANAFVTTVGGYTASEAKKEFWALYVNDKMSDMGAGSYITKSTDRIVWKIQTY